MSDEFLNNSYVENQLNNGKLDRHDFIEKTKKGNWRLREWSALAIILIAVLLGVLGFGFWVSKAPKILEEKIITIPSGSSLKTVAAILKKNDLVQSPSWFQLVAYAKNEASSMKAGTYRFETGLSVFGTVDRVANARYGDVSIKITIPEGYTTAEIARVIANKVDHISYDEFIEVAEEFNGFLYPETYFLTPYVTVDGIIDQMHTEFSKTLAKVASNRLRDLKEGELHDFVVMASIIEREALGVEDAYLISGVLWKRIKEGIPLQVDAPFYHLLGKGSSQLSLADLNFDSPFNTYRYKGLPPEPIGNPGAIALDAAFHPADSPYYFYLHDSSGNIHFGKNHNDHLKNKKQHLGR